MLSERSIWNGFFSETRTFLETMVRSVSRIGLMQPPDARYGARTASPASVLTYSGDGQSQSTLCRTVPVMGRSRHAPGLAELHTPQERLAESVYVSPQRVEVMLSNTAGEARLIALQPASGVKVTAFNTTCPVPCRRTKWE
eukprot:2933427-Prymnesium_polylepis.1